MPNEEHLCGFSRMGFQVKKPPPNCENLVLEVTHKIYLKWDCIYAAGVANYAFLCRDNILVFFTHDERYEPGLKGRKCQQYASEIYSELNIIQKEMYATLQEFWIYATQFLTLLR